MHPALCLCLCLFYLLSIPAPLIAAEKKNPDTFYLDGYFKPEIFTGKIDPQTLTELEAGPFHWTSQEKTDLRAADAPLKFMELSLMEVVLKFRDGKLAEIFISIYNRGDAGEIDDNAFASLQGKTEKAIDTRSGVSGEDLGDTLKKLHFRSQSKGWLAGDNSYRLDTAFSRVSRGGRMEERPEFINLTLFPGGLKKEDLVFQRTAAATDLADRIERLPEGDVLLKGVPMVDQGSKGYCALATMERILRYYGSEVNQHELAQQSNSSGAGTDPDSLLKALRGMGGKLGLRVNEKLSFDSKDCQDLIEDYNRIAKRKRRSEIGVSYGGVPEIGYLYARMEGPILRDVKMKSPLKTQKLMEIITESIDLGRPLAWAVYLGFVQETPKLPQGGGGHMRLIIGYNPIKKEVLYSDSWGLGHELKRMSLDDAYFITTGLYTVDPKL